uniref:Uncharacterized protein n=1 Tax=Rhizophora mucronata TaxID=61149 RepID=A0A2P2NJ76_RHIMU
MSQHTRLSHCGI